MKEVENERMHIELAERKNTNPLLESKQKIIQCLLTNISDAQYFMRLICIYRIFIILNKAYLYKSFYFLNKTKITLYNIYW